MDCVRNIFWELLLQYKVVTLKNFHFSNHIINFLLAEGLREPNICLLSEIFKIVPKLIPYIIFLLEVFKFLDFNRRNFKGVLILFALVQLYDTVIKFLLGLFQTV